MHGTRDTFNYKTAKCRYGEFAYYDIDELVGLALETYGEYSEGEVDVFRKVLRNGDIAIDVGANIGAFTIPMAQFVGQDGHVYAIEASRINADLLWINANNNTPNNVTVIDRAASDKTGKLLVSRQDALHAYSRPDINVGDFEIDCFKIDDLNLERCKLIKIDVDRHEMQVLSGARETIKRCKPIIYIENEHNDLRSELVAMLVEMGYRLYWHRPYQFNADNFNKNEVNHFGTLISFMNICIPDEAGYSVTVMEEVSDYRPDDRMFLREAERLLKYVDRDPDDLQSRWLAAHHYNLMQDRDRARELIAENLRRDPEHVPTLSLQGFMDMQDGNWQKGWAGYENRYYQTNKHQFGGDRIHRLMFEDGTPVPQWDGKPTDKPLLVWSEQGFGDGLMFIRFATKVLELAPNAFFEIRAELFELIEYSKIIPKDKLFRLARTLPKYELQCSTPSLPYLLNAGEEEIKVPGPYLFADPAMIANWKGTGHLRVAQTMDPMLGARIGLCLKGSPMSERPYTRDIPSELTGQLTRKYGPVFHLEQTGKFESFMQTASLLSALDLIITVDTSMAHLAGALGRPTWLLLSWDPDFRWGLKGDSTIWYPSVRIFRQHKFRDWEGVIEDVDAALAKFTSDW